MTNEIKYIEVNHYGIVTTLGGVFTRKEDK